MTAQARRPCVTPPRPTGSADLSQARRFSPDVDPRGQLVEGSTRTEWPPARKKIPGKPTAKNSPGLVERSVLDRQLTVLDAHHGGYAIAALARCCGRCSVRDEDVVVAAVWRVGLAGSAANPMACC